VHEGTVISRITTPGDRVQVSKAQQGISVLGTESLDGRRASLWLARMQDDVSHQGLDRDRKA
jgi:hypothetical protein